ncbi:MAG: sugar phosphate isomerase/epimerase [Candidatus Aureabacteria bacterium]|nr:sugar phosphate isomerase/epimerase [Candidatus Auribacterota bacterium]
MLALSTSWNADGRLAPEEFLAVLRELGLGAIELSYFHTPAEVSDISACCHSLGIRIVSVHNFCPFPACPIPDRPRSEALLLSSIDETERRRAVEETKRSLSTAASVGAEVLVLHLGRVEVPSVQGELMNLYRRGEGRSEQYRKVKERMTEERRRNSRRYFERVLASIEELCPEALRCGIMLAVENRFYYREIPSRDECREILERFEGGPIAYWHDIGHAQVMQNLGFPGHDEYLRGAGDRVCGFHIHDVEGCEDHLPPSKGGVDFRAFALLRNAEVLKVIELSREHSLESVRKGIKFLQREVRVNDK